MGLSLFLSNGLREPPIEVNSILLRPKNVGFVPGYCGFNPEVRTLKTYTGFCTYHAKSYPFSLMKIIN